MNDQSSEISQVPLQNPPINGIHNYQKRLILISIIALMILFGVIGIVIILVLNRTKDVDSNEQSTTSTTSLNSSIDSSSSSSQSSITEFQYELPIYFIRRSLDNELWIAESDGTNPQGMGIKNVNTFTNSLKDNWVFYTTSNSEGFFLKGLNIVTNENVDLTPDPTTDGVVHIQTLDVSPDGLKIVYQVQYRQRQCTDVCLEVDPYPAQKNGFYSYDIPSGKTTYLGTFFLLRNWDAESRNIYVSQATTYHEYTRKEGSNKINLETGEATFMDSETFYDNFNYFEEKGLKLKITANSSTNFSKLTYIKGGVEKEIDSGGFADLQPNFSISPDRNFLLYDKIDHSDNGRRYYKSILLDLNNLTKKEMILPEGDNYILNPTWINNTKFIYALGHYDKATDKETYTNLYIASIESFTKKKLFEYDDIYFPY